MQFSIPNINSSLGDGVRTLANRLGVDTSLGDKFSIQDGIGDPILTHMNIMAVEVECQKSLAQHPLETNTYMHDHVIFEPKTVVVTFLVKSSDYSDRYQELLELFLNTKDLFVVVQDTIPHRDLTVQSMSPRRDPGEFDTVTISISFHEFLYMSSEESSFDDPKNLSLAQYSDRQLVAFRQPQMITGQQKMQIESQRTPQAGSLNIGSGI